MVRPASAGMDAADPDHAGWDGVRPVRLVRYWSGKEAPIGRRAEAQLAWSDEALYVRFNCRQAEPLVVNAAPQVEREAMGLWDRDVCELFLAPDASSPEHYFEFEAAPTGEWLDLEIRWLQGGRETNWQFHSGMTTAARTAADHVRIAMRVPWEGIGRRPQAGERWRVNLFRCVGAGERRGYLAWQPTYTEQPNFHVPQAFGWLSFEE